MTYLSRFLAVVLALALCSSAAHAAPTDAERAVAVRLVVEGRARFDAQQYSAALELFKRAHEILRDPTTGIDLASAYEALGQLVEAREVVNEVVQMPVEPNEKPIFTEARGGAKRAIEALDSRIPLLDVHIVGAPAQAVRVWIDGKMVTPEDVDKPYAINPGSHKVVVAAPNYEPTRLTVHMTESRTTPVDVVLRPLEVPASVPPSPPPPPPKTNLTPSSSKSADRHVILGMTGGGFLLAGLGTGIAAAMTYQTMGNAKIAYERANQLFCDTKCVDNWKTYNDRRPVLQSLTIATTTLGALGVGAVLFAILDKPPRDQAQASFIVAPTPSGAMIQGLW